MEARPSGDTLVLGAMPDSKLPGFHGVCHLSVSFFLLLAIVILPDTHLHRIFLPWPRRGSTNVSFFLVFETESADSNHSVAAF